MPYCPSIQLCEKYQQNLLALNYFQRMRCRIYQVKVCLPAYNLGTNFSLIDKISLEIIANINIANILLRCHQYMGVHQNVRYLIVICAVVMGIVHMMMIRVQRAVSVTTVRNLLYIYTVYIYIYILFTISLNFTLILFYIFSMCKIIIV